jgi:hypothetical protein
MDELTTLRCLLSDEQTRADMAWRSAQLADAARMVEMKRRDAAEAEIVALKSTLPLDWDKLQAGWMRVIDEALVVLHLGVASPTDSYAVAKQKLAQLIKLEIDIATAPAVNGGWKMVPVEATAEMLAAASDKVSSCAEMYRLMLSAAPMLIGNATPTGEGYTQPLGGEFEKVLNEHRRELYTDPKEDMK